EMYNSFRYSGKRWDPNTKSYDLGFRNYSPEQGRFLTQDSYTDAGQFKGLIMDPGNANQYGFAAGDPVGSTDLDGHIEIMIENDDFPRETYIAATGHHYCPTAFCSNGRGKKASAERRKQANAHVDSLVKRNKAADKAAAERKKNKSHPAPSKPKSQAPPKPKEPSSWKAIAHGILDVAGMIDPTGIADGVHAAWYAFEGDYENALYTAAGIFPGGDAFKFAKNSKFVNSTTKRAMNATCKCFVAGTRIETEDGGKPIEEIDIGDKVLAKNEETGEIAYKEVEWLFQREIDEIYEIHIGDEVIQTTDEHPFWVVGEGWIRAKDLRKGDIFETDKGKKLAVDKIVKKKQKATVYNFKVKDFHTYYVSNLKVLTHNMCAPDDFLMGSNKKGDITNRGSWRKDTVKKAWEGAEVGPNGGRLCPSCGKEVMVPPFSGKSRDWDISHMPSWTNRRFSLDSKRKDFLDNYQVNTFLECPSCNRPRGNRD
ncbi:RHS repeat-associated protein, partial [Croceifilum oryzae]